MDEQPPGSPGSIVSPSSARGSKAATEVLSKSLAMRASEIDRITVSRVFERCHRTMLKAISGSTVPVEFLGALAANESGGKPGAERFEEWIYARLKAVAMGQTEAFWGIAWKELSSALRQNVTSLTEQADPLAVTPGVERELARPVTEIEDQGLRELSTSWGYTQIMGYHVIGRTLRIQALLDPLPHFQLAVELLTECQRRFHLRLPRDFGPLFRCWNTGRPDGKTFNPGYVAMAMRRMVLYRRTMKQAAGRPQMVGPDFNHS